MIEGRWMPQTEAEWQLLEDCHIITRMAAEDGVSKTRIASLLAFMASATAQQADFEESPQMARENLREQMGDREERGSHPPCPHCDEPLEWMAGSMNEALCPECREEIEDDDLIREVVLNE